MTAVRKDIFSVGVNDHGIALFESQFPVPRGMAYNSYVILDEKTAVLDTVDAAFGGEWLENVERTLAGRAPDYLVVHHMEPDHSANIRRFSERWPEAVIVASAKAFTMMEQFFGPGFAPKRLVAAEGTELPLGAHTLRFLVAPMVHWPEVLVSYETREKLLFSADAFGKFGANDVDEPWDDEARRYYFAIVAKFGAPVQALLKKAAALDIAAVCPLHGPVLEALDRPLALYRSWSSYEPEERGCVIAYASAYGHTRAAAEELAALLPGTKTALFDLTRCDVTEAVAAAFRYDTLVLASITYNGGLFPPMRSFLAALSERGFANRRVALIENGSWAPTAARAMRDALSGQKGLAFAQTQVKILSALGGDSRAQLAALAQELG